MRRIGNWKEIRCPVPMCRAYQWGVVRMFVGQEPVGPDGALQWHLSISTPKRYPTWDEIYAARYDFVPDDVTMAMILPPRAEYVNVHSYCFHLHQIPGEADTDLAERLGECDRPPLGWRCTRSPGHEGPCAALPSAGEAR